MTDFRTNKKTKKVYPIKNTKPKYSNAELDIPKNLTEDEERLYLQLRKNGYSYQSAKQTAQTKPGPYRIRDMLYPHGKDMDEKHMMQHAKSQLKHNHRIGLDKEVKLSDLNDPVNAWVFLRNIGIGEKKLW